MIVTGTEIVTTGATGTEDTTAIAIEETTTGGLEDMKEDVDTDGSARRDLAQGAKTTCKLMALQRVTAVVTVTEDEARNVVVEGTVWELLNEGVPPQQMRFSSP